MTGGPKSLPPLAAYVDMSYNDLGAHLSLLTKVTAVWCFSKPPATFNHNLILNLAPIEYRILSAVTHMVLSSGSHERAHGSSWCTLLAMTTDSKKFLQCPRWLHHEKRQESMLLSYCMETTQDISSALMFVATERQ